MSQSFRKEIRLFDAVMLVAGTMIGSGIFIVSAEMARTVGSPGYLLLAWVLSGFITIAGALSYGELAGMMPKAGGQYIYLREAYNPLLSFLYGWSLFLVIQTGTIAAVGVAFAKFTAVLVPFFGVDEKIDLGILQVSRIQLLAIASIMLLTWMNSRGVKNGKVIQNIFGSTKLIALALLIITGLLFGIDPDAVSQNFSDMWNAKSISDSWKTSEITWLPISGFMVVTAVGVAMIGSLFSSDAWNNVSFAGDEIQNPAKTLVKALAIGTGIVTVIYLLVNVTYLLILPVDKIAVANNDRVAVAAAEAVGGGSAAVIIALLIMVSTFGCNNGCILSGARVYYAMAKDRLFFPRMARLNDKSVPGFALWLQGIWASLLCLTGSYSELLDYVMFVVVLFYVITIAGVFILRRKRPDAERPYKAFGFPYLTWIYIVLASAFCIIIILSKPMSAGWGLLIVLLGIPAYFLLKRFNQSRPLTDERE